MGEIAPLLCRLWIYDVNALYLFENGVRLDLDFYRPSDTQKHTGYMRSSTVILHDPDGILAASLHLSDQPEAPAHPKWFEPGDPTFVDWFFWMFRQIVCWAKRAAQSGSRAFEKLTAAVDSLAQVRTRLVEMRLWTLGWHSGWQAYLGQADPACAQRLAQTYPRFQAAEVIACARLLLDEYERLCPAYCQKVGLPYPAHKVDVMRSLIAEFEQLG